MTYEEAVAAITPGLYRHFKGKYYRVLSIARHSETTEPMVVYQALYGNNEKWARKYDDFASLVDHKKYPEISQKFRFEEVKHKSK